jgi:hypothetical protein
MNSNKKSTFSALVDDIKKYVDLKTEYYALTFAEKVSLLLAKFVLVVFVAILSLVLLLLFIFLIYTLLMSWIGIRWVVLLIEIGIILMMIGILITFKNKLIIKPFAGMVIRIMLGNNNTKYNDND